MDIKRDHVLAALAGAIIIFLLAFTYKTLKGYSSSSECIVGSLPGASSNNAASYIRQACYDMFGGQVKIPSTQISPDKVMRIDGRAYVSDLYPTTLNVTAYNGNEDTTITGVYINVYFAEKGSEKVMRRYYSKIEIPPLSIAEASVRIEKMPGDFSWEVSGADGYVTPK